MLGASPALIFLAPDAASATEINVADVADYALISSSSSL